MESSNYFYTRTGSDEPIGPVSLVELRSLSHRGEIGSTTPVIKEGGDIWRTWKDYAAANGTSPAANVATQHAPVASSARSKVDRFLTLNFRFGKVIAALIGAFFLLVFVASIIYAAIASGDAIKAPTFEDLRPKQQSGRSAPQNFTDMDESRAVEKKYGDDISDIVKTFGLRSGDYDSIKRTVVELPDKYRREYVKGVRRVLEERATYVKTNGGQSVQAPSDLAEEYSGSFARAVANAARGEAEVRTTRLIALGIAAASCLAAFMMMTIPAILMIEQNTRRLAGIPLG